jgi:probable HAF family extracellular repeat protein
MLGNCTRVLHALIAFVALAATVLTAARPAAAADEYIIIDLGTLPGKANSFVWQQSVNNHGAVAVYANDIADPNAFFTDEPFIWEKGKITPLPGLAGATSTICYSVNNRGQGVGYSRQDPGGFLHGLLWDRGTLVQLPELPGDTRGNALFLNDGGQIVGFTRHPDSLIPFQVRHATLWYKAGSTYHVTRLPGLTGGDAYDEGLGINARGQIVGFSGAQPGSEHAVLWDKRGVHDLGTLGGPTSTAVAINNRGQIVGLADTATGGTVPFVWKKGVMTGLPIPPGDIYGLAQSINKRGQAVGFSLGDVTDLTTNHALLWEKGKLTILQTRISRHSEWTLLQACGINNKGQISGFGIHDGQIRAFLLTPVHGHGDDDDEDDED